MAEPLKPHGFWSYTASDDERSDGRLSQLRRRLADELQLQIGRETVKLFQDVSAIPYGSDWFKAINQAIDASSFFIPVITPAFLASQYCNLEVLRFRERERTLGRDDLIFPLLYITTKDISNNEIYDPDVWELLKSRQSIEVVPEFRTGG